MPEGLLLLVFVTLQRWAEFHWDRHNTRRLMGQGAVELGVSHYPLMIVVHAGWLAGLWLVGYDRPVEVPKDAPPLFVALAAFSLQVAADNHGKQNIVAVASGNADFSTLVAAIKAADLVDALSAAGPYTVFAPTNAAFAALPAGTLDSLLKPENKAKLQAILKYHVVSGDVKAADVVKLSSANTLEGSAVAIAVAGGKVKVNQANVTATDIAASNGTIHVIDAVLLPPAG